MLLKSCVLFENDTELVRGLRILLAAVPAVGPLLVFVIKEIASSEILSGRTFVRLETTSVIRILPFTVRESLVSVVLIVVHIAGMLLHLVPVVLVLCKSRRVIVSRPRVRDNRTWVNLNNNSTSLIRFTVVRRICCPVVFIVCCCMTDGGTSLGVGKPCGLRTRRRFLRGVRSLIVGEAVLAGLLFFVLGGCGLSVQRATLFLMLDLW